MPDPRQVSGKRDASQAVGTPASDGDTTTGSDAIRGQLRGMTYTQGLALLSPVQLSPGANPRSGADLDGASERLDTCAEGDDARYGEERLRDAIQCIYEVGGDLSDAMFDPAADLGQRQALRALLDEVNRRIAITERGLADLRDRTSGGSQASAFTNLLALAFGENTVGMHLRPRARESIRGVGASRLAAATAAYGAFKVLDRWALRGFASDTLDEIFASARGVPLRNGQCVDLGKAPQPGESVSSTDAAEAGLGGVGPQVAAQNPKLKWGNPKSVPTYGHTFRAHGQKVSESSMRDRARAADRKLGVSNECQIGAWNNDKTAADFLAAEVKGKAPASVFETNVTPSDGRAFLADGEKLAVDKARIVMRSNGAIRTAFPFSSTKQTDDEA